MAVLPLPMPDAGRRVFTVSELTRAVKDTLEGRFGGVWVEGEISNFRVYGSGHAYFTLKDEAAQVRGVLFRNRMRRIRFPTGNLRFPLMASGHQRGSRFNLGNVERLGARPDIAAELHRANPRAFLVEEAQLVAA